MGSDNSKSLIGKINPKQWTNIKYEGDVEIVKNNNGQGEAQVRMISLDPKNSIQKQQSIYGYRRDTNVPLVKCYGVDFSKSEKSTLCGNQKNVKVLTQRIPMNIQNIRTLTFPQSLYVLSQSFTGFDDLHRNTGIFDITGKMIGFNKSGQTKVWLNQNFAENHPTTQRPILQTTMTHMEPFSNTVTGEQRMVQTVLGLVENKCEQGKFPSDFDKELLNKHSTFSQAFNCVKSYILNNKSLSIPSRIDLKNKNEKDYTRIDPLINEALAPTAESRFMNFGFNHNQNTQIQRQFRSNQKPVTITYNGNIPSSYSFHSPRLASPSRIVRPSGTEYTYQKALETRQVVSQSYSQPYRFGVVGSVAPVKRSPQISINYSSPTSYYNPQVRYY